MLITQNNNGREQIEMITSSFSNTPFHMFMWIHRKWSFEKICTLEDFKKKKNLYFSEKHHLHVNERPKTLRKMFVLQNIFIYEV